MNTPAETQRERSQSENLSTGIYKQNKKTKFKFIIYNTLRFFQSASQHLKTSRIKTLLQWNRVEYVYMYVNSSSELKKR